MRSRLYVMIPARRHLWFVAYCGLLAAAAAQPLRGLIDLSMSDNTSSHLVLIPFVAAFLILQNRHTVFGSVATAPLAGAALMGVGLIAVWASGMGADEARDVLSWQIAGVVFLSLAGFVLIYGRHAARRALFPLLFLFFMVPIPSTVLAAVTLTLKAGSAEMVAWLLTLTGTSYFREGYVFAMPTLAIEVADACSGIRSSLALLLSGLLAGHMFLERWWTKALLVLAVLPVVLFKNAVRITALSLLAIHVDRKFLSGQLHHDGGIVFFLLGLAILVPVLRLLRNLDRRASADPHSQPVTVATKSPHSGS